MNQLNLLTHNPDEFVDKILSIRGRDYRIGERFRVSDQGYAHILFNQLSGLCLHFIQIRPEYQSDPVFARKASNAKVLMNAKHRESNINEGNPPSLNPIISVIDGNGGSYELHEVPWGLLKEGEGTKGTDSIEQAGRLESNQNYSEAIAMLEQLLTEIPNHTVALNNLASCYLALKSYDAATVLLNRCIEIEPNYAIYQGNCIFHTLSAGRARQSLALFHKLKSNYPLISVFDVYGIQACLRCGELAEAMKIFKAAQLVKSQSDEIKTLLSTATKTRSEFLKLDQAVRKRKTPSDMLQKLEALQARYPYDPLVQANLGLVLFADKQYQRAYQYLAAASGGILEIFVLACWVSAAFCLLKQSQWKAGTGLLTNVMQALKSISTPVNCFDVPGITLWINANNSLNESLPSSAVQLLEKIIKDCPEQELVTPEIHELAALYRQAAN